jgi:tyrosinase
MAKVRATGSRKGKPQAVAEVAEKPSRMRPVASATFAQMLEEQREVLRILKLPPWLKFPFPYERRDQAGLSSEEQQRFLCAINLLIANGSYGKLVDIHAEMHMQHASDRLLPWHRILLLQLEQAIRALHPDVSIPYWDWTKSSEQSIPSWLASVLPTVVTPTRTLTVIRAPGASSALATIASNVPPVMAATTFGSFAPPINGIHGAVDIWVGGTMSDPGTAAVDLIFWMHHANLDRLWWQWYKSPQGNHQNPPLVGMDAVMDPWPYTELNTRDIIALGYTTRS